MSGLLLLLLPASVLAEPVDLADARARWVEVAFEVSPRDRPGQVDTRYTQRIRAWLEAAEAGQIRVTVDGRDVERILLADEDPVPGSFSDFVWVFDAASGAVVSAALTGELVKELDWGLFDSKVRAAIDVDMTTAQSIGYKPPRRWMGQEFFSSCHSGDEARCTPVRPRAYDPERGYVNAIGDLRVRFGDVVLKTFSPLGEARLYEVEGVELATPAAHAPIPAVGSAFGASGAAGAPAWNVVPAVSAGPSSLR
jgi:hypothetical protein